MITRMARTLRRRQQLGDEGIALLLALVFVMSIGLIVAALLPYTSAGIKTAEAVRDVRTVQNAADAGVDQAINAIRGSFTLGSKPKCDTGAFSTYGPVNYANPKPLTGNTQVRVRYCNTISSTAPTDQPPFAIQTLQQGITVDGNAPLIVTGGMLANGPIDVQGQASQQSVNVDGDVYANGACDINADPTKTQIVASGVLHCSNTSPAFSVAGGDPNPAVDPLASLNNPFASTGLPTTVDPVGECDPARDDSIVIFKEGFYSQSPQPDDDPTSPTYCGTGNKHVVWWFRPGNYYFDFPDSRFPGFSNNDAKFANANKTIIGGVPLGWNPATAVASDVANMFKNGPSNTDHSPVCDETQPGAVFAFGGPTNISVGSLEQLEICAGPVGNQMISLFGLRTPDGSSRPATVTGPNPYASTNAASSLNGYLTPGQAKQIDASGALNSTNSAIANLDGDNTALPNTATLTLSGTPDMSGIPDGSLITGARLRLVYTTSGATNHVDNTLTYKSDVLSQTTVTLPTDSPNGGQIVPLTINGSPRWRALKDAVENLELKFTANGSQLNPTTVSSKGKVTPAETATSTVDGVQLEVSYIPPKIETTRCLQGGGSPCNIVTNTVDDTVFLHGTVYTAQSILEVAVHNYSTTVFERGVISYGLIAHVSASTKQTLPPFQLPKGTTKRIVLFTAQSLEPNGTWKDRIQALVRYTDTLQRPDGKSTASPGHEVKVLEWTVMR